MGKVKVKPNKLVLLPEKGEERDYAYAYKAIAELVSPIPSITEKTEIISRLLMMQPRPYLLKVVPENGEIKAVVFQFKKEIIAVAQVDPGYTLPYDPEFVTEFLKLAGIKAFLRLLTQLKYQDVSGKFISGPYSVNYHKPTS